MRSPKLIVNSRQSSIIRMIIAIWRCFLTLYIHLARRASEQPASAGFIPLARGLSLWRPSKLIVIWRYCHKLLTFNFPLLTRLSLLITLLIAACTADPNAPPPTLTPPAVIAKVLATVYMSPTPDLAEQQATRAANPPTATPLAQPTAAPTVYVGVFLGEAETAGDGGPVINPALLNAPTPFIPVTVTVGTTCPAQADTLFGNRWSADVATTAALGCPIEGVGSVDGSLQIFERGVMYYSPSGEIWAIAPAGQRFWYAVSAPPVPPGEIPVPEGLLAPSQGFGAVWRGLPGVQDALGFARSAEQVTKLSTQKFQNGLLLADGGSGQVFVLLSDGQALGPY